LNTFIHSPSHLSRAFSSARNPPFLKLPQALKRDKRLQTRRLIAGTIVSICYVCMFLKSFRMVLLSNVQKRHVYHRSAIEVTDGQNGKFIRAGQSMIGSDN
jgi:hypothetical protein